MLSTTDHKIIAAASAVDDRLHAAAEALTSLLAHRHMLPCGTCSGSVPGTPAPDDVKMRDCVYDHLIPLWSRLPNRRLEDTVLAAFSLRLMHEHPELAPLGAVLAELAERTAILDAVCSLLDNGGPGLILDDWPCDCRARHRSPSVRHQPSRSLSSSTVVAAPTWLSFTV